MFSIKRGGELGVEGLFIIEQLEQERAVALKKEITKYKNELNNIKKKKLLIESKNTITNNNNADVESQLTQRSPFDFPPGKPEGDVMKAIAYVLKIKSTLRAPAMRSKIRKIPKEEIELKYNVMLEKVSDIDGIYGNGAKVFDYLLHCWCNNPVSNTSLCLIYHATSG